MTSTPTVESLRRDWRLAAQLIDHTLLRPEATRAQIAALCREAAEYGFYSACVNPANIARCSGELRGTGVKVCAVIAFPLGAATSKTKLKEAGDALSLGAGE